jgi:hypothetical protein
MGEQIHKNHLAFVMETSKGIKTDVALQGLLGRVCGYHSMDIRIYLHEKCVGNGDLARYVAFSKEKKVLPKMSRNLISMGKNYPIIPVGMEGLTIVRGPNKAANVAIIKRAYREGKYVNFNAAIIGEEVQRRVLESDADFFIFAYLKPDDAVLPALYQALEEKKPLIEKMNRENIRVWVCPNGSVCIYMNTGTENPDYMVPHTNKKDIFCVA